MIFSATLEEHMHHLKVIFGKLRQHNLRLKLKKCSFLQLETNYLGFVISEEGIKADEKKVEAIRSLPVPTCVVKSDLLSVCVHINVDFYQTLVKLLNQLLC